MVLVDANKTASANTGSTRLIIFKLPGFVWLRHSAEQSAVATEGFYPSGDREILQLNVTVTLRNCDNSETNLARKNHPLESFLWRQAVAKSTNRLDVTAVRPELVAQSAHVGIDRPRVNH